MRTFLLVVCFALSGSAALIYQTAWIRELTTIYGSTVYATGALLAAFMGGLAAGGAAGSRYLRDRRHVTFRSYGVLEFAIAGTGSLSQLMLPVHEWLMVEIIGFLPMGYTALLAKASSAFPFILLPTMAMGATLPIFVRAWVGSMDRAGSRLSTAYSLNTLGAVAGTLCAAFLLIPQLGVRSTIWIAAALNAAVGVLAFAVGGVRHTRTSSAEPAASRVVRAPSEATTVWAAVLYFVTGFAAIAAEVMWMRILVLHIGTTVYAFAVMLAVVLMGIGLGSLLVAHWADRLTAWTWYACITGLGAAFVLHLYAIRELSDMAFALGSVVQLKNFFRTLAVTACTGMVPLFIPTLLMGMAFPLGIRLLSTTPEGLARRAGRLYAANSSGAILGAILTATALLGSLGVNGTAFLIACLYLGSAVLIAARMLPRAARTRAALAAGGVLPALLFLVLPREPVLRNVGEHLAGPSKNLVAFEEGATSTVTVRKRDVHFVIEINLANVAGTTPELVSTQKLQAHLPLLLHPDPRSVLHIGYGSGGTTYAVSRHPVERIDVVEISPDVVRVANRFFPRVNRGAFEDPRVHFYWGDGRNYLLASRRQYDVILSDSIHPSTAGNGSLYTVEYFRHAARRLEPGGIFSTWLPMYRLTPDNFQQILKALADAFEHIAVWYAHNTVNRWVIVTASPDRDFGLPGSEIDSRFAKAEIRADLAELDYSHPLDLFDNLLLGNRAARALLADAEPHRDDRPRAEYESVIESWDNWKNQTWRANMAWLVRNRESFADYLSDAGGWPADLVERYASASDLVVQGHMAFLRCRTGRALDLFERAVAQLPQHREPWDFEKLEGSVAPGCRRVRGRIPAP